MPETTGAIHWVQPPSAAGTGAESSVLACPPAPVRVLAIADSVGVASLHAHGIKAQRVISPPLGRAMLAWPALMRSLDGHASPTEVEVTSNELLRVAAWISRWRPIRVRGLLAADPSRADARAVRVLGDRLIGIRLPCERSRDAWVGAGVQASMIDIIEPAPSPPKRTQHDPIRSRLPEHLRGAPVIVPLWDHPSDCDARRFAYLLAILSVSGRVAVGVVPESSRYLEAARRYHRVIDREFELLTTSLPLAALLPHADVCVWADPLDTASDLGARALLAAYAESCGVTLARPPKFANPAGPTPPEMARPVLDALEGIDWRMQDTPTRPLAGVSA